MQLPTENVMMRFRNPGASMDLVIPVDVVCNTPDEVLISNITKNSRLDKKWLEASDPHNGIAIICGSGPSIADDIEEIRAWKLSGAKVFALNGCAAYLDKFGILPDYQVMCDARKENIELIGPAKEHLFASQCDPSMFEAVPDAILWHLQIGDIESYFPKYDGAYALIGGAASVGNTTTCICYAMGYRTLHLFGFDSSHKGESGHAFHQKLNEGDPTCITEFNGKTYLASLTMKHQAEKFHETARALQQMGTKIHVHGYGLLPDMWNTPKEAMSEHDKYERMWGIEGYRAVSPGEMIADTFVEVVKPYGRIIDFGCGTGRGSKALSLLTECEIVQVDFAENSRDEDCRDFLFYEADLSKDIPVYGDCGFCTDVMEHIPTEQVDSVINNIMGSCSSCFYQISTVPDVMGEMIGQDLHLTVRPHKWWHEKFESLGYAVLWEEERSETALFHIS